MVTHTFLKSLVIVCGQHVPFTHSQSPPVDAGSPELPWGFFCSLPSISWEGTGEDAFGGWNKKKEKANSFWLDKICDWYAFLLEGASDPDRRG